MKKVNSGDSIMYEIEEDVLRHYGVKGMRWGHRKNQAVSFMTSGSREVVIGKQLVASFVISYGVIKLSKFAVREAKYKVNKVLNKYDKNTLRETRRYYDKKIGQYVYRYD